MTQCFWSAISIVTNFADDSTDLVWGDTDSECNEKIKLVVSDKLKWYSDVGLPLNAKKSELLGVGFTPDPISIEGNVIEPKQAIKFLGVTITSDLKMDTHVNNICNKLRFSAGRIRSEGMLFSIGDRRLLFNAWCRGTMTSNALAYLPSCNASHLQQLNTALNCGLRSVAGLPRYGKAPLTAIRENLKLPTADNIKEYVLLKNAWKHRSSFSSPVQQGPVTRGRSNLNVPHPVQKGPAKDMVMTHTTLAWNRLPLHIKIESKEKKALEELKKFCFPNKASNKPL